MRRRATAPQSLNENKHKTGHYLYPLFLILFIIISMFLFIFGDNGFYSHQRKIEEINRLKKETRAVKSRLQELNNKLAGIKSRKTEDVEREARLSHLKKPGDILIKLYHSEWIENKGKEYEKALLKQKVKIDSEYSFIDHYKTIIGFLICLGLATIITVIHSRKQITPEKQGK